MCQKNIIVNSIIQSLKSKQTSLKKYTNRAKLTYFSLVLRELEEKKNISHHRVLLDMQLRWGNKCCYGTGYVLFDFMHFSKRNLQRSNLKLFILCKNLNSIVCLDISSSSAEKLEFPSEIISLHCEYIRYNFLDFIY